MKLRLISAILIGAAMCAFTAQGKVAKPGVITTIQPDGSTLRIQLRGDERSHITLSEDGFLLSEQPDGFYGYATVDATTGRVVSSGLRARDIAHRTAADRTFLSTIEPSEVISAQQRSRAPEASPRRVGGYGLFPGSAFPSIGKQKALVILVQYSDVKFTTDDPYDYFFRMLNEEGFSDYGGVGSCRDWYINASMGQFEPEFDVYGPITLSQTMAYYGGNDYNGDDKNPEKMVIEACQQLDSTVDFSQYDRDGDGYIDNVYLFYAGYGEADSGIANTVWPHSWDVTAATSTPYRFDGVRLDRYGCSSEMDYTYKRPDGIGTFVHEFGHVLGLPDLYDTAYTTPSPFTPDKYDVMDMGSYSNQGRTPPTFSAFERDALGWIEPTVINGPFNGRLDHLINSNHAYIIPTPKDTEYFLLEGRQQTGFDKSLPYHGMLIWHIDYNPLVWNNNTVNNKSTHQYVDLIEADGKLTTMTRTSDPFPGKSGVTSYTFEGNPSFATWSRVDLQLPITDIAEAGGVVTFKVAGGVDGFAGEHVLLCEPTEIGGESFCLNWEPVAGATDYSVSVWKHGKRGEFITDLSVGNVTSYVVNGADPQTVYRYTVQASDGTNLSHASAIGTLITTASSGIGSVVADDSHRCDISLQGLTLYVKGTPGTMITVADIAGRIIGSVPAASYGNAFDLPAQGMYIVRAGSATAKIMAR